MITLEDLLHLNDCPKPYAPGAELWNDPHISKFMLQAHLSPDTDEASYKPQTVRSICNYLVPVAGLKKGDHVVDLGCGPGLYCANLTRQGYFLTGIDRSENSIRYAKGQNPDISYICGSYLEPFGVNQFKAAIMVSKDYGVLSPKQRGVLLANIHRALKQNGYFIFDVCSMVDLQKRQAEASTKWYATDSWFWSAGRHFVLEKTIVYKELPVLCDFVAVLDEAGLKQYNIYQTFFSPTSISKELEKNGFRVETILSNLTGEKYDNASLGIGIVCKKV